MVRAIEMLNSVDVLFTEFLCHTFFILIVKIKVTQCQLLIFFNYLVEDVNIKRQSFSAVKLFDKLSADWTSDSVLMMQFTNTACAKGVSAVH